MIFRFLLVLAILVCSAQAQTKFVKSVPTLTELRALNVADIHTNVLVNSYWTSNTNSIGAIFQWVPGATDATNTYSVFAPASGTGRWIRVETPANPGSASQPGFRFFDNQRSGVFSGLGTNIVGFATDGTERWRVTSAGVLQAPGAQTIQTATGVLTLGTAAGNGNVVVSPNGTGNVGINTTGPDRKLDVLDTTGPQIRATYTDGAVFTDIQSLSNGATLITNTAGQRVTSSVVNDTAVLSRPLRGGLAFDGVTTTAKDLHTIADLGTSDATIVVSFQVPTAAPSVQYGVVALSSSSTTYFVARGLSVLIDSSGRLSVTLYGSTTATSVSQTLSSFVTNYGGKLVTVALVRSVGGSSMTVYVNGVAQTMTETISGNTWADTMTTTYAHVGSTSSSWPPVPGPIYSATLFNRALSASEVVTLANNGVQEADKWGSMTALIGGTTNNGNFEAGAGAAFTSWASGGTLTVAEETVDMHSGTRCPKITGAGSPAANNNFWWACNSTATGPIVRNKRHRYSVWLKRVSGTDTAYIANGTTVLATVTNANTWQEYTGEFVQSASTGPAVFVIGAASSSVWLVDDVTVTQIGSILDADLTVGVGYQAPDRSSNHYDGLISTSGVSHVIERRQAQARFSLSADGYLGDTTSRACIPADARIESITAYSTGTPTFTVGDDSGSAANVVGSVTLVASTITDLTLLKRFLTTGTDGRCYVDFTAGAAATTFTITYSTSGNY